MSRVRVKLPNGSEATLPSGFAEAEGLPILNKPAVDSFGRDLPPKMPANLKAPVAEPSKEK